MIRSITAVHSPSPITYTSMVVKCRNSVPKSEFKYSIASGVEGVKGEALIQESLMCHMHFLLTPVYMQRFNCKASILTLILS